MEINRDQFTTILSRVWQRPLPAIVNYVISLVSALVFAPMLTWTLRATFRRPLLAEAINARSLDLLLNAFSATAGDGAPLLTIIALVLLPLAFLLLWALRIMIEGMALHSYDSERRVPFRGLLRAGWRWILPFFGQGLISFGVYVVCLVIAAFVTVIAGLIGGGIAQVINSIAIVLFVVLIWLWSVIAEIARATAIVENEGNIAVGIWEAAKIARQIPLPLLALHGASTFASLALVMVTLWLNRTIPVQWWLLSFALLQLIAVLRVGIRFSRWAGNVALVQACAVQVQSDSGIS